ncbi:hypothetical protein [Lysobacter gummosus]|uniref:hypothetical protein n=1 Tax=Lysobacter gummosus TaxID=262324 RepID=UPI003631E93E
MNRQDDFAATHRDLHLAWTASVESIHGEHRRSYSAHASTPCATDLTPTHLSNGLRSKDYG